MEFVNPYTMVPLATPQRAAPAGHSRLRPGRHLGRIDVHITAVTPLLLGRQSEDGTPALRRAPDGTAIIPGSSLHGAVRALHEAVAGGCLRVLDDEFVPVHRDPASPGTRNGDVMAVVEQVDDGGRPLRFRLCDPDTESIRHGSGNSDGRTSHRTRTGDRVVVPAGEFPPRDADTLRPERGLGTEPVLLPGQDVWVVLVTDTRARNPRRPCTFTVGRLTGDTAAPAPGAWELYLSEVDDADDLRPAGTGDAPDIDQPGDLDRDLTPVHWPPQKNSRRRSAVVGHRLRSRRYLHVGQPVWVRLDEGRVVRIKLSQLWRSTGEGSAGERAERDGVQPCHDPGDLCPSCRVFGSADVRGRGEGDSSEQRGYRGHVRFRDARATGEVSPLVETLAPLSAPHPSAGQFYLDNTGAPPAASRQDARPIAHWGSEADDRDLRRLRGRKFYWRTSDPLSGGTPRGRARDHHSDKLTSAVALVPATTQFTTTVTFENLTPAEIGGLLVALDPRRLDSVPSAGGAGEPSALVATVGGGRPFGLGAVTVDASLVVEDTDARYLGQEPSAAPTEAECLAAFDDSVGGAVREKVWPALRHALALDFVDRDLVWYPPGRSGERGTQPYDEGYDFWQRSNGSRFSHKVRPLVVLPDPTGSADDQILESFPEEESVPGSRSGPGGRGTGPRSGPGGRGAGPRHAGGRR